MKEMEKLRRRIHWSECVHLALLTLVLAFVIIMTFQSDDYRVQLLFGIGTVIPVQLIRFICERFEKKPMRLLLSLAVIGLSISLTWAKERWSCYLICCIPILISGVFLPRSRGRILLTVPSLYSVIPLFAAYAYGKAVESLGVPLVADLTLILTALLIVNFFVYTSQTRLLKDITKTSDTEVSMTTLIRQNRKSLAAFLLIGVIVLAAVPFLLRTETQETVPVEIVEMETKALTHDEEPKDKQYSYREQNGGTPLNLEAYRNILLVILILIPSVGVIASIVMGIRILLSRVGEKKKSPIPKLTDGVTIERLEAEESKTGKERLSGYEKKIRRRYEKLIRGRVQGESRLAALTPTELERAADLNGPGAETVHEVYRLTRYSQQPARRETYTAFREAIRNLPPVREKREDARQL